MTVTITYEVGPKGECLKVVSVRATDPHLHLFIPRWGEVRLKPDTFGLSRKRQRPH